MLKYCGSSSGSESGGVGYNSRWKAERGALLKLIQISRGRVLTYIPVLQGARPPRKKPRVPNPRLPRLPTVTPGYLRGVVDV